MHLGIEHTGEIFMVTGQLPFALKMLTIEAHVRVPTQEIRKYLSEVQARRNAEGVDFRRVRVGGIYLPG